MVIIFSAITSHIGSASERSKLAAFMNVTLKLDVSDEVACVDIHVCKRSKLLANIIRTMLF